MRPCIVLFVLVATAAVARAQCGPDGCSLQYWREIDGDPGRIYLFRNGRQIGGWDYDASQWRSYDARTGQWSEPTKSPPAAPPVRRLANYGVDADKLGQGTYQLNGKPATRQEIDAALGAPAPADAKKFHLVASGDDAERKRLADAWQSVEPETKARVALCSVPANHWSLQDTVTGKTVFRTGGLTFQSPGGKVLHRQADFAGSEDFTAIRKAIRAYDADKDPDLRKAAPVPLPPEPAPTAPTNNTPWLALLALAVANYFMHRKGA